MFIRLLRGHGYEKRKRYEQHDPGTHCKPLDCHMDTRTFDYATHHIRFSSEFFVTYTIRGDPLIRRTLFFPCWLSFETIPWFLRHSFFGFPFAFDVLWVLAPVKYWHQIRRASGTSAWPDGLSWVGYYSVESGSALCQFASAMSRHGYVWCGVLLHFPS